MKLLYCKSCHDLVALIVNEVRVCRCGNSQGVYTDNINAVYHGERAVPLGITNDSFFAAMDRQPAEGRGETFTAFVIPKSCPTFKAAAKPLSRRRR